MKVVEHTAVDHALPPDDDHPYRTGVWKPQVRQYDAFYGPNDTDVIGEIPADLNGVYLRNTETALFEPIKRYHPFDGDALMHSISFEDGRARYSNRFIETEGFLAEQQARQSLWAGITEHPSNAIAEHGWGARTMMKDNASTDVVVHGGQAFASFYQCGDLYAFDPRTLKPQGKATWGGDFPSEGVSAHSKVDEHTGELLFFNYHQHAPFMHYGVVDRSGTVTNYVEIPLPGPRLPHDLAFTENYTILNDLPLGWDEKALADGWFSNRFWRDLPSRFAIIPRHGSTADIRWFEADPTFVLHWANAYEDGDEIVLDGYFQHNPTARGVERSTGAYKGFETLDMNVLQARAHRWRFNLKTGATVEESLSDRCAEFPMVNGRHAGRHHRYIYEARCTPGLFAFDALIKRDVDAGTETLIEFDPGVFVSETVVAPRTSSIAEDDGYLVTFTSNMNTNESHCVILDAADPGSAPIAEIRLPERISSGTHSTWAPLADL